MQTSNILAKINDGIFFERIFGQELDWDAALDARDSGAFDASWRESNEKLAVGYPVDETVTIEVREAVFKVVFRLTANPDLAAYVSDDFGLITQANLHGADIAFISRLWDSYVHGIFPR
ncbi:hypothetical protein NC77_28025 [Janthinobacterium lividum]|uniref:hypothetical protein n=1 Tax=Janthinobacterium lividum TaxID=29581 RepID=UPI000537563F|nr:hypothetical protein [Janthinobacterium lividum]KHA75673.1 hypothetical protein NC77_28025 [Janthinobacterium lividum]